MRWYWEGVDAVCGYAAAEEDSRPSTTTWRSEDPWPGAVFAGSPRGAGTGRSTTTWPSVGKGSASRDAMIRGSRGKGLQHHAIERLRNSLL